MSDSDDKSIILHQRGFPLTNSSSRKSRSSARRSGKRWIQGTLVTASSHSVLAHTCSLTTTMINALDVNCQSRPGLNICPPLGDITKPTDTQESIWRIIWEVFWNKGGCLPSFLVLISEVLIIHDQISETFLPLDLPPGVCGWEPVVLAAHANPFIDRSHQARKCTKAAKPAQKFLF